ncbi:2-succinyl-6-hydroxy-2,4-cyclohexadiene-1-carboxylate synthase [Anabaena azotica]|uniref:2-succinyl-6-hydroxy-2, 4-cyclohexadiene-1-carboxylate synthase n=1 Tax=Anabaena azotica TaxID=197653 RepID=UPI0039A59F59
MNLETYRFNYSLAGNLQKPLILFLHGFMGNIEEFDEAIKLLGDNFSYLTLDLPGHGKTQVLGNDEYHQMEYIAKGLINLLEELKIEKCFLVGYSMGGRLALYLTLHFPEKFIKVVLESASPGLETNLERLARIKSDSQIAKKLTRISEQSEFHIFLDNWYNQPIFSNIQNHPKYQKMIESRLENKPLELAKSLQFMGTGYQPSLWENMKESKIPLLLLVGENDEKFIKINTLMSYRCKIAQLKIISQVGHNTHIENTLSFVQNLHQFISVGCGV